MAELTKYDSFFDELAALEKQVYFFKRKHDELKQFKDENKSKLADLEKDNINLKNRVEDLEKKIQTGDFVNGQYIGDLFSDMEEKGKLKKKIEDLIKKVDNHLSS
ncbi:MAG: hypothetical protein V1773_06095 [bacterium]